MTDYMLMDARAASDPDDAMALDTGSAAEMCAAANRGDLGAGCVVVNENSEVMWEWFATGKWIAPGPRSKAKR